MSDRRMLPQLSWKSPLRCRQLRHRWHLPARLGWASPCHHHCISGRPGTKKGHWILSTLIGDWRRSLHAVVPGNSGQAKVKTPRLIQRWEVGGDAPGVELFESWARVLGSPPSLYPHPLSPPSPPVQQHRAVLGRTWKRSRVRRRPRQEVEWQVRKSRTWYSKGKVHTP